MTLAAAIRDSGGRAYVVGGAVRDQLLGRPVNDWDLEVYGLAEERLEAVIASFGPVKKVGGRFGVFVLPGIELALPQGPSFRMAPDLALEAACRRRDFTINAMLWDPLRGELLDYFGGMDDLQRGLLRRTDPGTFNEDPLRVLRAARLAGQLRFQIDPDTAAASRALAAGLVDLPWERIQKELLAWLLRSNQPGRTWNALVQTGAILLFPAFRALQGVPMSTQNGFNGDVWAHTERALDAAVDKRTGEKKHDLPLMLSVLLLNLGSVDCTRRDAQGRWRAAGLEQVGMTRARYFLRRWFPSPALHRDIFSLLKCYPAMAESDQLLVGRRAALHLALRLPDRRLFLSFAESISRASGRHMFPELSRLRDIWIGMAVLDGMPDPWITGADLARLGLHPGPVFSRWLKFAYRQQLSGRYPSPAMLYNLVERLHRRLSGRAGL